MAKKPTWTDAMRQRAAEHGRRAKRQANRSRKARAAQSQRRRAQLAVAGGFRPVSAAQAALGADMGWLKRVPECPRIDDPAPPQVVSRPPTAMEVAQVAVCAYRGDGCVECQRIGQWRA